MLTREILVVQKKKIDKLYKPITSGLQAKYKKYFIKMLLKLRAYNPICQQNYNHLLILAGR